MTVEHPPPTDRRDLLGYLSAQAMDQDYAYVSARKAARPAPQRPRPVGPWGAVALAVFAALLVVAGLQTSRASGAEEAQRRALVAQVDSARADLEELRIRQDLLRRQTNRLQDEQLRTDRDAVGLRRRLDRLSMLAGTTAVRGPGIEVTVDDAPNASDVRNKVLDSDLQRLVNGIWAAGAEAIAVNGERLTNLSAIRQAGTAITVNNRSLRRPYVVTAIGNRNTLPAAFAETSSGQAWLDLTREVGLRLDIRSESSLRLPAADVAGLRFANRQPGGTS